MHCGTLELDWSRWPRERGYLVAVSGGMDSMCLWHTLMDSAYETLVVAHVDHGLRGPESHADAEFVRAEAERRGCPCEVRRVDVEGFARERRLSLETAARELRYRALAEIARERSLSHVFLAHHADDRVETFLINLFRGSGSRGLRGMVPESTRVVAGTELTLLRPFLGLGREAIRAFAENRGIAWREDASNQADFALRNRVRHRLLPEIEAVFGRDPRPAVLRAAELATHDEAWIAEASGEVPRRGEGIDVATLRDYPEARRNRLLLDWLRESGVPDCGFAEVVRATSVLLSRDRPAKASLPGGCHVRRRAGTLFIERE